MANTFQIHRRDDDAKRNAPNTTLTALLIAILCFSIAVLLLVGALWYLRRRRSRLQAQELPLYVEKYGSLSSASTSRSGRRTLFGRFSEPFHVSYEKQALMREGSRPHDNTLPEIRITLPEEFDASGKRQSGRVVVLHIGTGAEGIGPLDELLPAYQEKDSDRFQSLDLERIGGLVEQARNAPQKI